MMTKQVLLAAIAVLATGLGMGAAFAQKDQAPLPPKTPMHPDMDHRGMMDISQMNRMMDNCNRMMESMQWHAPSAPTPPDKG